VGFWRVRARQSRAGCRVKITVPSEAIAGKRFLPKRPAVWVSGRELRQTALVSDDIRGSPRRPREGGKVNARSGLPLPGLHSLSSGDHSSPQCARPFASEPAFALEMATRITPDTTGSLTVSVIWRSSGTGPAHHSGRSAWCALG
jgi:hypothetical protein